MASAIPEPTTRQAAPTVKDLRLRLCWICREEEKHGEPAAKRWVHPCSCTLIAHEPCLLEWIKSAQESRDRSKNALKCPQCGTPYQLSSRNPPILRALNAVNQSVSRFGTAITITSFGGIVLTCAGGIYILLASYGGVALKEFLGREYFAFILTDDPKNWSWWSYLSLPFIPLSLITSRLPIALPFPSAPTTLLPVWAGLLPPPEVIVPAFPGMPAMGYRSVQASAGPSRHIATAHNQAEKYFSSQGVRRFASIWPLTPAPLWPPSPTLICFCYPIITFAYQVARDRLVRYVSDSSSPSPSFSSSFQQLGWPIGDEDQGAARIDIVVERAQDGQAEGDQRPAAEGGNDNNDAAERGRARITISSLGRLLGGALAIPTIASICGGILLRFSRRSRILRAILATRENTAPTAYRWEVAFGPKDGGLVGVLERAARREGLPSPGVRGSLRILLRLLTFGNRAWIESDPVWWRNGLGLGIFIVLKDAVKLLHLWLLKQELESRHIKDRDFSGIDPKELDLVHPWPSAAADVSVAR